MARLGGSDLAATTDTAVYTCPVGKKAFVAFNICCRSGSGTVRMAHTSGGVPAAADYIEYAVPLAVGGPPLLREGLLLAAGEKLYAWASAANFTALVYGKEDDA